MLSKTWGPMAKPQAQTMTSSRRSEALPRWATSRRSSRDTLGPRIGEIAKRLGTPLMPWQQMVADVGFEIDSETGLPAYREVIVTMPRQNGKTSLLLAAEVERALLWDVPQHIIYTAQTGADARKKLLDDQLPVLQQCKFIDKRISRYHRASGSEGIYFENHSRLQLAASSEKSGHGPTVDLAVLDEVWADEDNRREQSLVPMMNTRPAAQTLVVSTQGTDRSLFLNRKTERGRIAVEEGKGSGTAYLSNSFHLMRTYPILRCGGSTCQPWGGRYPRRVCSTRTTRWTRPNSGEPSATNPPRLCRIGSSHRTCGRWCRVV